MTSTTAIVVLMGVSGSGKSRLGRMLAERLAVPFLEGDDLHTSANVAKMARGEPLDDDNRAPWLAAIHRWMLGQHSGAVVACSALKRTYRDMLASGVAPRPRLILLAPSPATLTERLRNRAGHFMPASLLDSQLATLEPLQPTEHGLTLANEGSEHETLAAITQWLDYHAMPAPKPRGCAG